MSKIAIDDIVSMTGLLTSINNRLDQIETALNNQVLYRANPSGEPNEMNNVLDMNNRAIINLPDPVDPSNPVRLQDLTTVAAAGIVPQLFGPYTADGVETSFSAGITLEPGSHQHLVWIDGVTQVPGVDFTVSSALCTFTYAPPEDSVITIITLAAV